MGPFWITSSGSAIAAVAACVVIIGLAMVSVWFAIVLGVLAVLVVAAVVHDVRSGLTHRRK